MKYTNTGISTISFGEGLRFKPGETFELPKEVEEKYKQAIEMMIAQKDLEKGGKKAVVEEPEPLEEEPQPPKEKSKGKKK